MIVDEACQTTEPNILIPFQYNPRKVILVGDPEQLEATVISQSRTSKYERSQNLNPFEGSFENSRKPQCCLWIFLTENRNLCSNPRQEIHEVRQVIKYWNHKPLQSAEIGYLKAHKTNR